MNHRIESMKPSASMVLMARAKEMQKTDPTVIGLAGGEPDFPTPDRISMAAIRSLTEGYTHYVVGPGLPELRQAIQKKLLEKTGKHVEVMVYGDGAFKDPVGKIWELADPVVSPGLSLIHI